MQITPLSFLFITFAALTGQVLMRYTMRAQTARDHFVVIALGVLFAIVGLGAAYLNCTEEHAECSPFFYRFFRLPQPPI